jgi:hypothetical protein
LTKLIYARTVEVNRPRIVKVHKNPNPVIPTGDIRHMTAIRDGKISSEIFSKERLAQIPLDPGVAEDLKKGRGKVVADAAEKVLEGRKESQARNVKNVRAKTRKTRVLRDGEKTSGKRKSDKSSKSNVSKAKQEPTKKKVTKKKYVKKGKK